MRNYQIKFDSRAVSDYLVPDETTDCRIDGETQQGGGR